MRILQNGIINSYERSRGHDCRKTPHTVIPEQFHMTVSIKLECIGDYGTQRGFEAEFIDGRAIIDFTEIEEIQKFLVGNIGEEKPLNLEML